MFSVQNDSVLGEAHLFSIIQCFPCFEGKRIFIHWTLNLRELTKHVVCELITLLVYDVKRSHGTVFFFSFQ